MTDYPDWQTPQASAAAIGATSLVGTGLAIDPTSGGSIATDTNVTNRITALHAPGATIANEISTTGAPLLRNELAVAQATTAAIAPGGSTTVGPFTINTPSYEIRLALTAAAVVGFANGQIVLKWFNANGTQQLAQKTFAIVASTQGHVLSIAGPVRGAQLQVTLKNSASSGTNITFFYSVVASSRLAFNDLMRTMTSLGAGPPSNETWPGINMDVGLLGNQSQGGVGAGSSATFGLAAYNGPVQLQAQTGGANNTLEAQVVIIDTSLAVNVGVIFDGFTNANGVINQQFNMPMAQCFLNLINRDTVARTLQFCMSTAEPNVN
jgi:hypothetical protein